MICFRYVSSSVFIAALGVMTSPLGQCQGAGPATYVGAAIMDEIPKLPKSAEETEGFTPKDQPKVKGTSSLRQDFLNQLQSAHALIKVKKYADALAKLRGLDAVANKTPHETFLLERTRVAIASMTGDETLLVKSLEAVIATDRASGEEQINFMRVLGNSYYEKKDYPKATIWLSRYFKEGGKDVSLHARLARAYYLNNDLVLAAEEVRNDIKAEEAEGEKPTEDQLRLLASCALKLKDKDAYAVAIEKFVIYYPKKEYWTDLVNRLFSKPGFSDRLSLDVYRLMHATGQINTANDFTEMAQGEARSGYAPAAIKILDEGFKSGVFGTGADAAKPKNMRDANVEASARRLKTIAKEEAQFAKAKDGNALVDIGYFYVTDGQFDKGIGLIEQGIRVGGVKRPEHAKLHLAIAYLKAGRNADAIQAFKAVEGTDGAADLARYWMIHMAQAHSSNTP